MSVTHDECRDAVAANERDTAVDAHLGACERCRAFADAVARVDDVAATLTIADVPADLADRVTERVLARPATGGTDATNGATATDAVGVGPSAGRLAGRRSLPAVFLRSGIAAAVVVALLVGGLVVSRNSADDPQRMALISAARAIEEEGTAGIAVSGEVEVTVAREGAEPDFSEVPPEMQAYFEARWAEMMAEFERSMAELERQMNDTLDAADRMLDDAFRRFGHPGAPPPPPAPPASPSADSGQSPGQEPPVPPERLSVRLALQGSGVVDVDGRLQLDGTLAPAGAAGPDSAVGFGVVVDGEARAVRQPDGSLARLPGVDGPLASVLARPGAIPQLLRSARDVRVVGTVDVGGERGDRYRFMAEERQVEAVLGADGRLRRLIVTDGAADTDLTWRSTVSVEMTGYGVDASGAGSAAASASASVERPAGSSSIVYPFGSAVSEALRRDRP